MLRHLPRCPVVVFTTLAAVSCWMDKECLAATETVRSGAAISVHFDEPAGNAGVTVSGYPHAFSATLQNGTMRVASPFWNQAGKRALQFDAAKKQFVQLTDIPYLDRPNAVTLSFFFLSLHPATDPMPHGILGKRSPDPRGTNYGINYVAASDIFQFYVNDGRGYRIASYSARQVLGVRRAVHLTVTLEINPVSPSPQHADQHDLLARLFVNGEPVAPKSVAGGERQGFDARFTNVKLAGLLNDAPLTLGSSNPDIEHVSGLIDEFLLFTRALSPSEVRRLFLEVAGANGPELARLERDSKPLPALPSIRSASQLGLQMGRTTRVTIQGTGLTGNPRVDLPIAGLKQTVVRGSGRQRLTVDLTLPAEVPPGIYPLSVVTDAGISKAIGIAVDGLPQLLVGDSLPDRPVTLPGAFSGLLSGAAQGRVYFSGKAGMRVVAEVEAKRIGSKLEPVLELKSASGSTLAVEWGKTQLRGDARAEVTLPADGTYFAELHDLAYNAPGDSPYRLLLGDLRSVDAYFPPVVERGTASTVEPVGIGIPAGMLIAANLKGDPAGLAKLLLVPPELHASGPLPPIRISDGTEILEVAQPENQLQLIDARFADRRHSAVAVNGRLMKPGELDRYLLAVTSGQTLSFSVEGRSFNSPVEGSIALRSHPDGKMLAGDGGTPETASKGFQYRIPADVSAIEVSVRDLLGRGGLPYFYRLKVVPAGQATFNLALLNSQLNLPRHGRALVKLRVDRSGYAGPILLKSEGDARVKIAPEMLPAEAASRTVLVTFASTGDQPIEPVPRIRIVGESVGMQPAIRRVAVIDVANEPSLAGFLDQVPVAARGDCSIQVESSTTAPVLLKGINAEWPVKTTIAPGQPGRWIRLSLVSTETPRPIPEGGRRRRRRPFQPLIAAIGNQSFSVQTQPVPTEKAVPDKLKVSVPSDVVDPAIDFALKADVVTQPFSDRVLATTYSKPFRVLVQDPLGLEMDSGSLNLTAGSTGKIRGKLVRHPAFKQSVNVAISGLPAGYSARSATVAGEQGSFELAVTTGKEAAPRDLPNMAIVVSLADGKVAINRPVNLRITPPAPPKKAVPKK